MADVKISGLPASTVPLAGTEVLPIVQGGATKQVSIANVTAGRSVAALSVITPTIQAEAGSAGGTIKNGSGVAQMQWGSGGASNLSLEVATNINPANAAVNISPTGTGTVAISPAGALTINPTAASTINNVAIGGTTAAAGKFTALEATGITTFSAGTVSAPAITTTGDTNTGIFFPAADTIAFTEGGAESVRIHSSGGVSIGNTTDPGANNLSVTGTITSATSISTPALLGTQYALTSFSGTTAIVDTGIIATTATASTAQMYQINIKVNLSSGGPTSYRAVATYLAGVSVGSSVKIEQTLLHRTDQAGIGDLTLTSTFWDGSTEATSFSSGGPWQIRLKLDTIYANPSASLECRITQITP